MSQKAGRWSWTAKSIVSCGVFGWESPLCSAVLVCAADWSRKLGMLCVVPWDEFYAREAALAMQIEDKPNKNLFAWLMNMWFGWREPSSFSTSLMAVLPFSVVLSCMHTAWVKKMGTANTFQTIPSETIQLPNLITLSSGYLTKSFHQKMWKTLKQLCVHRKTSSRALSLFLIPKELRT